MIQKQRIRHLNDKPEKNRRYVAYWMQASQRAVCNHALEYATRRANSLQKPLVVFFGLTENFPDANERHYTFMLEGLEETRKHLEKRGIRLAILRLSPEKAALKAALNACLVVTDRGYTRIQDRWRREAAAGMGCLLTQVESDVVVPVEETSSKEEFAARSIRPKIKKIWGGYLKPLRRDNLKKDSLNMSLDLPDEPNLFALAKKMKIDRSVGKSIFYRGGTSEAEKRLKDFLEYKLKNFPEWRNDPNADALSNMSPYLHFGQISPLYIALKVMERKNKAVEDYLEELIIRRELSQNFTFYNKKYDKYEGLPDWCRRTLGEHASDKRESVYGLKVFEKAETHDPYWNAAQKEMVITGKMHGYMRMYWGKKILEWSSSPEEAFLKALILNNKYEIDGRDPNGFTGVAWCFGKHDRPWAERSIFGKVRYMNERGLRRKFDADGYVKKINTLADSVLDSG
ncbi:MAG: deoxyribodipyrimidine photo-lyase [Candidatus Aminicenantes bacterium]|nr:deoxyribodipyrimidine photo-lyase [Candidatus Aminicenantes bacterium]